MAHSKAQSPTPPSFPEVWALFKSLWSAWPLVILRHASSCALIQLTLTCLQLSRTFRALFFPFSTDLSGSYKCKAWSLSSCMSSLVQHPILVPYVLLNIIFYRIQTWKIKRFRNHLSEMKAILHRVICLYSTLGVYHKFNTEIHGWWESANILIFVFICTCLRFYNKYE